MLGDEGRDSRLDCRGFTLGSGADRDRTGDPLVANQVLSQLSYRPSSVRPKYTQTTDCSAVPQLLSWDRRP